MHGEHAHYLPLFVTFKLRKKQHNIVSQLMIQGSSETNICIMYVLNLLKLVSYETQV